MTELTQGRDILPLVKNLIHGEKQVKEYSLDLTVREVFKLEGPGSIDFGGSEYAEPKKVKVNPVKQKPDDKYEWWHLEAGTYLVTLNETIEKVDGIGFLSPHPRLMKAGCTHTTLFTLEWRRDYILPLTVGENGLKLKENARISKLLVLKL
jgi:deoxycytidine triphosphate deaminase